MPLHTGMECYTLRLDHFDGAVDLLRRLLADAGSYLVVREDPEDNPHYHVVFRSAKRIATLREQVRRGIPADGNGAYSLKKCGPDVERLEQYCCKGPSAEHLPELVLKQGIEYSHERIKELHEKYWVENNQIQANRLKRKKMRNLTMVELVEEEAKHKGIRATSATAREDIAEIYIRKQMEARKPINLYHCKGVVNTVHCLLCSDDSAIKDLAMRAALL